MSDTEYGKPVVFDNGSGLVKIGYSGEDGPVGVYPSIVGTPKAPEAILGSHSAAEVFVGEKAMEYRGVVQLVHPTQHGRVCDYDAIERIINHGFNEHLKEDPSEHPILWTECALNPRKNRERVGTLLFETFEVPALSFAIQAVLALYARGEQTGLVVDIGDGVTHIVPVWEGFALPHAIQRQDLAGADLTDYFVKLLRQNGVVLDDTCAEREIARDIKENLSYVAFDYQEELDKFSKLTEEEEATELKEYELPDGQTVKLGSELFQCTEGLFKPPVLGKELLGVHSLIKLCAQACPIDTRRQLYQKIVLSGGTTMCPGFKERLEKEMQDLMGTRCNVDAPAERKYSVWIGGAILTSLSQFHSFWISRADYDEHGTNIFHTKSAFAVTRDTDA